MVKFTAFFCIIALLLCSTLTHASARLNPTSVYPEENSFKVLTSCSWCISSVYVYTYHLFYYVN
ncbi:PSK5 [Arabidopsis thaliana]|uniref:PSK5 n=1 Tax=Arabidopsis thaliana TaxID=3702 RepID=A0A178URY9_ARATH|nr:PSK5 [Arabidopsis thaliana]